MRRILLKRCAETWTMRNPSWSVAFLDSSHLGERIRIPSLLKTLKLPLPALSDYIRLSLLKYEGGVWADATLYCARPLDDWIDDVCRQAGFFAYDRTAKHLPVATWFLASIPDSRIIHLWYAAALRFVIKTKYCLYLRALNLPCESLFSWIFPGLKGLSMPTNDQVKDKDYFWVHKLFQSCLNHNDEFRELWLSVPKIGPEGPHTLQRFGLLNPVNTDVLTHIENVKSNVYKLTRREVIPSDISGTILDALYRSARDEPPERLRRACSAAMRGA